MPPALKIELTQRGLLVCVGILFGGGGVGFVSVRYTGGNLNQINERVAAIEQKVDALFDAHFPKHTVKSDRRPAP